MPFKYLLMTVESKSINLEPESSLIWTSFFMGTSNDIHFQAFKKHPDFNSFKGRINFIRVPYLLSLSEEMNISMTEQIKNMNNRCRPLSQELIDSLCLFAIMSRLRAPQKKIILKDKKVGELLAEPSPPLKKLLFLDRGEVPDRFTIHQNGKLPADAQDLLAFKSTKMMTSIEGNFGVSPREIKQIIYEVASKNKIVSFIEILELLEKVNS